MLRTVLQTVLLAADSARASCCTALQQQQPSTWTGPDLSAACSADTWFAVGAGVLGLGVGIGAPTVYVLLQEQDEKKLQELRELNRKSKEETGEYMSEVRGALLQHAHRMRYALSWTQIQSSCAGGNCRVQEAAMDRPQVQRSVLHVSSMLCASQHSDKVLVCAGNSRMTTEAAKGPKQFCSLQQIAVSCWPEQFGP